MTIKVEKLSRFFNYNGMSLPDPGQAVSLEQVRDVFSIQFPEIVSAEIEGPVRNGNRLEYTIRKAVGAKG